MNTGLGGGGERGRRDIYVLLLPLLLKAKARNLSTLTKLILIVTKPEEHSFGTLVDFGTRRDDKRIGSNFEVL